MLGKDLGHYYALTYAPITFDFCSCKEHYCLTATEFMEKAMVHQWRPCAFTFRGIHFPLVFIKKALCSKGQPTEIHNPLAHTKDIPHSPILFSCPWLELKVRYSHFCAALLHFIFVILLQPSVI